MLANTPVICTIACRPKRWILSLRSLASVWAAFWELNHALFFFRCPFSPLNQAEMYQTLPALGYLAFLTSYSPLVFRPIPGYFDWLSRCQSLVFDSRDFQPSSATR